MQNGNVGAKKRLQWGIRRSSNSLAGTVKGQLGLQTQNGFCMAVHPAHYISESSRPIF